MTVQICLCTVAGALPLSPHQIEQSLFMTRLQRQNRILSKKHLWRWSQNQLKAIGHHCSSLLLCLSLHAQKELSIPGNTLIRCRHPQTVRSHPRGNLQAPASLAAGNAVSPATSQLAAQAAGPAVPQATAQAATPAQVTSQTNALIQQVAKQPDIDTQALQSALQEKEAQLTVAKQRADQLSLQLADATRLAEDHQSKLQAQEGKSQTALHQMLQVQLQLATKEANLDDLKKAIAHQQPPACSSCKVHLRTLLHIDVFLHSCISWYICLGTGMPTWGGLLLIPLHTSSGILHCAVLQSENLS